MILPVTYESPRSLVHKDLKRLSDNSKKIKANVRKANPAKYNDVYFLNNKWIAKIWISKTECLKGEARNTKDEAALDAVGLRDLFKYRKEIKSNGKEQLRQ